MPCLFSNSQTCVLVYAFNLQLQGIPEYHTRCVHILHACRCYDGLSIQAATPSGIEIEVHLANYIHFCCCQLMAHARARERERECVCAAYICK